MIMPEATKQIGYFILAIIVLGVIIFLVMEIFFQVKIGRGVCNIVVFVIGKALGVFGFASGAFSAMCDMLPF